MLIGEGAGPSMAEGALGEAGDRSDRREFVKVLLIGSPLVVKDTIRVLYVRGFAEVWEWSPLQPTQTPGEVMSLLRRLVRLSS